MTRYLCVVPVLMLLGLLLSCDTPPERQAPTSNPKVTVEVITRFEGVTLYRVRVDGTTIYVARTGGPSAESTTTRWNEEVCTSDDKGHTTCHDEIRQQIDVR